MRQKRAKSYKKQINVYVHTFKFREPFQTIVDSELILTCQKASFDIVKGLNRTVQSETKPMITQCCMQALYSSGNQEAISIAKGFERRRCNHQPSSPEEPAACIESIVAIDGENKHRYIVASQEHELRKTLRKIPGVPLIFMNRSVMVMEPLSYASAKFSENFESKKLTQGLNNTKKVKPNNQSIDKPLIQVTTEGAKKRKGPKAPNPLSMKKKKVEPSTNNKISKPETKRRRKHRTNNDSNESKAQESSTNA
ncbi:rRNA-processing protein Utp23p [[Candida] anglica]